MFKKYFNTISAFQLFQLIRYGTFILIGIVFAKSALSTSDIGHYETFIFLSGALCFFWLNGLIKGFLPLSKENQDFFFNAFVILQVFSFLAVLLLFFLQGPISIHLLNGKDLPDLFLLGLFILIGTPASLTEHYYLIKKNHKAIVNYGIIVFSATLILVAGPALLGKPIHVSMQGLVISSLLRYIWLWIILFRQKTFRISIEFTRKHLRLSMPLILATFLSGSAQYIDGFIVNSRFSEDTFAIFRYGARELPFALLLVNALSNSMLTSFGGNTRINEHLSQIKRSIGRLMWFLFPITMILLLVSKPLFPLVFNPDFKSSATIFNIYLLLLISRILLPQTILNGMQKTKPIVTASALELFINIVLSLTLVQKFGINGIAFATVVAFMTEKIYLAGLLKRKYQIEISQYLPVKLYMTFSILTIVLFVLVETFI